MFAIAVINGHVSPLSEAKISLSDRGLLFGHAVFETLLVHRGEIIGWNDHYSRLQLACITAHLSCPEENTLRKYCSQAIAELQTCIENEHHTQEAGLNAPLPFPKSLSLKILVTGGDHAELKLSTSMKSRPPSNVYILCQQVAELSLDRRLQGFSLKSFEDKRSPFLIGLKSTSYLFQFLCLEEAQQESFDDAIYVNERGEYTEGATSAFLWFDHNYHVFSTPVEGNCLASTSILKLRRVLQDHQISFQYSALNKNQTTLCAGCALISSVRGLIPIKNIDGTVFDLQSHTPFFKRLIELSNL